MLVELFWLQILTQQDAKQSPATVFGKSELCAMLGCQKHPEEGKVDAVA